MYLYMVEWCSRLRDIYCVHDEKLADCISKAYDYSLLHMPLIEGGKLLGLIDFYRLAGVLSLVKDRLPSLRCRDILKLTVTHVCVKRYSGFDILLATLSKGKYTSMGVENVEDNGYIGTIMASDIASVLAGTDHLSNVRVKEVYSRKIGIISTSFPVTEILKIIARRRQPCLIVFDGRDVSGILCLSDVLYLLSQFEAKPPLENMYAEDFLREPVKISADTRLNESTILKGFREPLLVLEDNEISGMLTALDVVDYVIRRNLY